MFILLIDDGPDLRRERETGRSWTMGRMRVNGGRRGKGGDRNMRQEDNCYLPDAARKEEMSSSCIHDWQEEVFRLQSKRDQGQTPTRRFHKMSMGLDAFLDHYTESGKPAYYLRLKIYYYVL